MKKCDYCGIEFDESKNPTTCPGCGYDHGSGEGVTIKDYTDDIKQLVDNNTRDQLLEIAAGLELDVSGNKDQIAKAIAVKLDTLGQSADEEE